MLGMSYVKETVSGLMKVVLLECSFKDVLLGMVLRLRESGEI